MREVNDIPRFGCYDEEIACFSSVPSVSDLLHEYRAELLNEIEDFILCVMAAGVPASQIKMVEPRLEFNGCNATIRCEVGFK